MIFATVRCVTMRQKKGGRLEEGGVSLMPAFSTNRRRLRLAIRLQGGGCNRTFLVLALNIIRRTHSDYIHAMKGRFGHIYQNLAKIIRSTLHARKPQPAAPDDGASAKLTCSDELDFFRYKRKKSFAVNELLLVRPNDLQITWLTESLVKVLDAVEP